MCCFCIDCGKTYGKGNVAKGNVEHLNEHGTVEKGKDLNEHGTVEKGKDLNEHGTVEKGKYRIFKFTQWSACIIPLYYHICRIFKLSPSGPPWHHYYHV